MDRVGAVITALDDPQTREPSRSGGKGANLAAMTLAGLPVPDGFVVTTDAYRTFIHDHGLESVIERELRGLAEQPDAIDAVSQRLRGAFEACDVPAGVRGQLETAYLDLNEPPVAVRSSATAEDLPEASFAGQQDTVLDVTGIEDLCCALRRCWSSLWTARAISYRQRNEIGHTGVAVAVVVQRMVPADTAGVMFTADPVSGRRDRLMIEAAGGLGDVVVSGHVTPQRWVLDHNDGSVVSEPEGTPVLVEDQLRTLAGLGRRAADLLDGPQDLEWAFDSGNCWLLQSRPITSLFPLPPASPEPGLRVYLPAMLLAQGIAEPFTPAGNAFFGALTAGWIRYLVTGRVVVGDTPPAWLPTVAGRLFIDATPVLQRRRLAARLTSRLTQKEPTASAVVDQWLAENGARLLRPSGGLPLKGMTLSGLSNLARMAAVLAAPGRARRRVLAAADLDLMGLQREAAGLNSPAAQLDFVENVLPARTCELVVKQLPVAYGEQFARVLAEGLVRRWLGPDADFDPVRRWLPHDPTVAMGAELARIARETAGSGCGPTDVRITSFLKTYGHRAPDREIDMGLARFADDPSFVLDLIRQYQRAGGELTSRLETGAAQSARAADDLVAQVRRRRGAWRARVLRSVLNRHRELGGLRERPKFDMVRAVALGRGVLARVGATLVTQGSLTAADDVYFLTPAQLRAAVHGPPVDLRAVAALNRRDFRRELRRRAVPRILASDGEAVYGPRLRPGSDSKRRLVGTAVAPGSYEGVVRVLDSPVGATLQPGEVLVAASTDPGWTPLFLVAGALVMEVGGTISHGAVVAREYGVPAVADVPGATDRLHTGQRVRVDGNDGSVTVLDTEPEM
ncbi:PEP-utilizing enzyme [Mycobacterium sp. CVI_P3]|uniref:PEP-utilizing enzyme n=1 Tax=Mycobacterium pinniadriaticum TaxID=2994102 RepID=A0ABT3S8P3_9MYCO|nr:PEP/pyruvate-binding domain-containing protein [Mycobacterium pinniadriaticum]MCX2929443.1 PEP-utilizing enzyme [Mycobacterium pinniadriaticum]MCX2935867.1 PEP-utilizing enzyme [Mycobacterium pinniadriaticum]